MNSEVECSLIGLWLVLVLLMTHSFHPLQIEPLSSKIQADVVKERRLQKASFSEQMYPLCTLQ